MSQSPEVRVRIAPSPTGDPHVGTAYVLLFNTVLARKYKGKVVLRIEDTDRVRSSRASETAIFENLKWLGLHWDEGPDVGGPYGPYRQSERQEIYLKYADELVSKGKAYPCFCSSERLDALRLEQKKNGSRYGYDGLCRSLSVEEVKKRQAADELYVIRLKIPDRESIVFNDEIRGKVEIKTQQIDDQVLLKSDGYPTYHLANVVDDHLMKITHVMRAEEWISSTPKHVLLYEAFDWKPPQFIHLPLLRNSDKSKISKRRNPVSIDFYRQIGIVPEAMVNFLSLMGWAIDGEREIFSLEEMITTFNPKDIHLGGPVFDQVKLRSVNQQYIAQYSAEKFSSYLSAVLFPPKRMKQIAELMKTRVQSSDEFIAKANFFFEGLLSYDEPAEIIPKKVDQALFKEALIEVATQMDQCTDFNAENIECLLKESMEKFELKPKFFFMPLRMILTGRKDSPSLFETIEVLGREICRARLRDFLGKI